MTFLLVEDNPADIHRALELLNGAKIANRLSVVSDGVEAMEFLRRGGLFAKAPPSGVILLDLNLSRKANCLASRSSPTGS